MRGYDAVREGDESNTGDEMINPHDPLYREALTSVILHCARRLLVLGIPPEEIRLRGDGYAVTIAREYRETAEAEKE